MRTPKLRGYNEGEREIGKGPLDAILWLVGGEVAFSTMEKKDKGEKRSVAHLWVALLSMQSPE